MWLMSASRMDPLNRRTLSIKKRNKETFKCKDENSSVPVSSASPLQLQVPLMPNKTQHRPKNVSQRTGMSLL